MNESRQRVVNFLEKEIKTYVALSLFLARKDTKEHLRVGGKSVPSSTTFYKERMKEAKRVVYELRKPN